jgi:hypothetical protein
MENLAAFSAQDAERLRTTPAAEPPPGVGSVDPKFLQYSDIIFIELL